MMRKPERQQRRARGRGHVQRLERSGYVVVAARHARVAEQELRDEGGVEAEDDQRPPTTRPQPSGYVRPNIFGNQ